MLAPGPVLSVLVALAFVTLMPPALIDGRISTLEISALLLAGSLLVAARVRATSTVGVPIALLALLGVMLSSAAWSDDTWATLRDVFSYAILAAFAWTVIRIGGWRAVVNGISTGIVIVLLMSLGLLLVDPDAALYYDSSGFQGIYSNRNTLGFVLIQALPAVLSLHAPRRDKVVAKFGLVLVVLVATVATTSRTALVVAMGLIFLWLAMTLARRWRWVLPVTAGIALVVVVTAIINSARVLEVMGKTASLNGRAVIWDAVIRMAAESPLIGFGWSRSWTPGSPHSEAVAARLQGQIVFHAHNELLNWLITTGIIGTACVAALFLFVGVGGVLVARRGELNYSLLPLLVLAATIARGITDISETNALGWTVLMFAVFGVARFLPESRSRALRPFLLTVPLRARVQVDRLEDSAGAAPAASKNGGSSV